MTRPTRSRRRRTALLLGFAAAALAVTALIAAPRASTEPAETALSPEEDSLVGEHTSDAATTVTDPSTPDATSTKPAGRDFMRGIVVSCPRAGQIWGSPKMTEALREMQPLGVNWVAIHPYAGVRRDGSIRNWFATDSGYLPDAAKRVRDENISLFWKPHLAYWGSFSWRGEIEFGDDTEAWKRFFDGYRAFIVDQAKFAQKENVPLFAVGVELERTVHFESEWRSIIADVRKVYEGEILYAANWDSIEKVPFWDALDAIGVHAYFPVGQPGQTTRASLKEAWRGHLASLDTLSKKYKAPIVLAEIGYTRSATAAAEPWAYGTTDTPENRKLRELLIDVAIEEIEKSPSISGMFWWKWIPGNDRWDRDFSMRDPEARAALAEAWGAEKAEGR